MSVSISSNEFPFWMCINHLYTKHRIVRRLFGGCKMVFIKINYHEFCVQHWMVLPLDLVQCCPFEFIYAINIRDMAFWRVLWVVDGNKKRWVEVERGRFLKLTLNSYILANPRSILILCWCIIIDCNILRPHKQSNLWCVKDLRPKKHHWCGFVLLSHRINMNSDFCTYYFIVKSFAQRFIMLHVSTFWKKYRSERNTTNKMVQYVVSMQTNMQVIRFLMKATVKKMQKSDVVKSIRETGNGIEAGITLKNWSKMNKIIQPWEV